MTSCMGETGSLLAILCRSKNDPGLEIFLVLYDENIRSINELRTDHK